MKGKRKCKIRSKDKEVNGRRELQIAEGSQGMKPPVTRNSVGVGYTSIIYLILNYRTNVQQNDNSLIFLLINLYINIYTGIVKRGDCHEGGGGSAEEKT